MRVRSAVGALVVLIVLGLFALPDSRDESATSFGRIPGGYGALYDLLLESGLPVARSYAAPHALDPATTVWWVAPAGLCRDAETDPLPASGAGLLRFVEAGGTAVIFWGDEACAELAELVLPGRSRSAGSRPPDAEGSAQESDALSERHPFRDRDGFFDRIEQSVIVDGGSTPRTLDMRRAQFFTEVPDGFAQLASVDGEPFALQRSVRSGRLVVVADSAFLENRTLDRADAAPLAGDFARRYGAPLLDECMHGLRLPTGPLRYLMVSPARWSLLGLIGLSLLYLWWGSARQVARPPPPDTPAPSLAAFVATLARIYGRSGDVSRVADRYRALTLARVRRHQGLGPDTDPDAVLARLESRQALPADTRSLLVGPVAVRDSRALRKVVRRLDLWAQEVCR